MSRRLGFTLIEVMVAAVMAALLMAALLMVLASVGRDRARLTASEDKASHAALLELLQWDLANSTAMTTSRNGLSLVLEGHGSLDPRTKHPTGRLARVAYLVRDLGRGQTVLVRRQEYMDDPLHREPWTELASVGTKAITITSQSGEATTMVDEGANESAGSEASKIRKVQTPSRLHVQLLFDDGLIEREVNLR